MVDTFIAGVSRGDDFFAAKGSDVGAEIAAEFYLVTRLSKEALTELLQLIDAAGFADFENHTQAVREKIVASLAASSLHAAGAIKALKQLSMLFGYILPGPDGRNPLRVCTENPGSAPS